MQRTTSPPAARPCLDRQNIAVLAAQLVGWGVLLEFLHAGVAPIWKLPAIVVFCLMMQGVFSMMHECFHRNGHRNGTVNWAMGALASTLFGSSYTLIRVNHEGHHQRNRSNAELAEFILPGERAAYKIGLYYFAILGGIWIGSFVATLVLPLVPFRHVKSLAVRWMSMDGYNRSFAEFDRRDWALLRLEAVLAVAWWAACVWLFGWDWRVLATAYACFAFSYSSLQWIYHMHTPLDRIEGAYDLRLPTLVRWLFLNFNYNLSHHRMPRAPWQALHAVVDVAETQPLWWRYLCVFRPPRALPPDASTLAKHYF
jgi:fatty acid desaturase